MPKAFLVRRRNLISFLAGKKSDTGQLSDSGKPFPTTGTTGLSTENEIPSQKRPTLKYSPKPEVDYFYEEDIEHRPFYIDALGSVTGITKSDTNKCLDYFNLLPRMKDGYLEKSESYISVSSCHQHTHKESTKDTLLFPSTSEKPFGCAICGKTFRLSSTLCRHKIIHTSQRPHKCHVCEKSFNRSSTLKTHLRTHNKTKEFICHICDKGFHQKGNLRNHVLIHTGEKPYSCQFCEKSFNKLSNLKFHMHCHTDHKPYRCRFCKTAWSRRGDLKQHIIAEHKDERMKEIENRK